MAANFGWFPRVNELTLALVRSPSITESAGEAAFAPYLQSLLLAQPYFRRNPGHVRLSPTQGDPLPRENVFALVRATQRTRKTIILAGHYDVVSTSNYGALEPLACDPAQLLPALRGQLRYSANAADVEALRDLDSGDWMPGRGALDMKSGIAAGMAVLERHAEMAERDLNLLLLLTPDEENYSHGMRSAAQQLPELCAAWDLAPVLSINLDAAVNTGESLDARAIYLGSVGKMLPFVHFVGRPTHAGAPFDGIPAALLAAEFVRIADASPALGDDVPTEGELPPAPVVLRSVDLKPGYDVTTPAQAFVALNVLTYRDGPEAVLGRVRAAAGNAMRAAMQSMLQRARAASHLSTRLISFVAGEPLVLDVASLREQAADADALAGEILGDRTTDVLAASSRIVQAWLARAGIQGPAAVVGFAPVYYPVAPPVDERLRATLRTVLDGVQRDGGHAAGLRPFFTGISDMSFLAQTGPAQNLQCIEANAPGWSHRWSMASLPAAPPAINIGPWGRDYHQRNERVYMPYSFETVPELIWRVVHVMASHP